MLMGLNDDITTDLDQLTQAVQGLADAYTADNTLIADLQAQLAAGSPGLTADQGQAILDRLVATQKIASDALGTAGVAAPAPVVTPAP
jgi:hypothetical protein